MEVCCLFPNHTVLGFSITVHAHRLPWLAPPSLCLGACSDGWDFCLHNTLHPGPRHSPYPGSILQQSQIQIQKVVALYCLPSLPWLLSPLLVFSRISSQVECLHPQDLLLRERTLRHMSANLWGRGVVLDIICPQKYY